MDGSTIMIMVTLTVMAVVFFDFTNGFHDASNMIATLVAARAMSPAQSVVLVGSFTFLGPLIGGTAVANTIGSFVDLSALRQLDALGIVASGVVGAIAWNLLTWRLSIPSSSSHALVGGLVGAVLVSAGAEEVVWGLRELSEGKLTGVMKIVLTLFLSPLVGFVVGFVIHRVMRFLLRAAQPSINQWLRRAQWITAAGLAFAHGTNDAQKGMGIITLVLLLGGALDNFHVPLWVIIVSAASITLGTVSGGWNIVRTVGFGIYKLRPLHGLDVQLTSTAVIIASSMIGGPVSTTHIVSTSIMGIGASERPRAVHWDTVQQIGLTWLFTLPGAAVFAALAYLLQHFVWSLF